MPYRFIHGESFEEGLIRIGLEQIDRARSTLKHDAPEKAIHEARKSIKRMRALLRLVRSGIGETAFTEGNKKLRDIARTLSGARDRAVLLASIDRLSKAHPELAPLRESLERDVIAPSSAGEPDEQPGRALLKRASKALASARDDWRELKLTDSGFVPVAEGLATTLKVLRSSGETASAAQTAGNEAGTDEAFAVADEAAHDWRKAAQRHWRHMRLLENAWPSYFRTRADEAKAVSDLLGDAQDLALLAKWLEHHASAELPAAKARQLIALARDDQTALREEARMRTERLTAERAKAHARMAERLWDSAGTAPPATPSTDAATLEPVSDDDAVGADTAESSLYSASSPHEPASSLTVAVARTPAPARKKSAAGGRKRPAARTTNRTPKTPKTK